MSIALLITEAKDKMRPELEPLARFVRNTRKHKGLNQDDVRQRGGPSKGWLGALEAGTMVDTPKPGTLKRLAAALGVDPAHLLRLAGYQELGGVGQQGEQAGSNHDAAMVSGVVKNLESTKTSGFPGRFEVNSDITPASEHEAGGIPTSDEAVNWGELLVPVPVYGPAACGEPLSWSADDAVDILYLPPRWVEGVDGAIRVRGSSMSGYGINDGDEVLVRKVNGERPPSGKPVVLCVDDAYVVKMFRRDGTDEYLEEYVAGEGHGPRRCHYDRGSLVGIVVRSLKGW